MFFSDDVLGVNLEPVRNTAVSQLHRISAFHGCSCLMAQRSVSLSTGCDPWLSYACPGREEEPEPEPEPEPLPGKTLETGEDDTTVAPSAQSRSETDQPASKRRRKLVSKTFQDEEGFMGECWVLVSSVANISTTWIGYGM